MNCSTIEIRMSKLSGIFIRNKNYIVQVNNSKEIVLNIKNNKETFNLQNEINTIQVKSKYHFVNKEINIKNKNENIIFTIKPIIGSEISLRFYIGLIVTFIGFAIYFYTKKPFFPIYLTTIIVSLFFIKKKNFTPDFKLLETVN